MSDLIVGLTGGIGSGKTTVANLFAELGVDIIDADIIARDVVAPNSEALDKIVQHFGATVVDESGNLNRHKLREIVFANNAHKTWLNALLHPLIRQQMIKQCQLATSPYCLLVVPLLIENKLQSLVNRVLVVDVSRETQIARTQSRDNSSLATINAILDSQVSANERRLHADDIIDNNAVNLANLKIAVAKLHQSYIALAINSTKTDNSTTRYD